MARSRRRGRSRGGGAATVPVVVRAAPVARRTDDRGEHPRSVGRRARRPAVARPERALWMARGRAARHAALGLERAGDAARADAVRDRHHWRRAVDRPALDEPRGCGGARPAGRVRRVDLVLCARAEALFGRHVLGGAVAGCGRMGVRVAGPRPPTRRLATGGLVGSRRRGPMVRQRRALRRAGLRARAAGGLVARGGLARRRPGRRSRDGMARLVRPPLRDRPAAHPRQQLSPAILGVRAPAVTRGGRRNARLDRRPVAGARLQARRHHALDPLLERRRAGTGDPRSAAADAGTPVRLRAVERSGADRASPGAALRAACVVDDPGAVCRRRRGRRPGRADGHPRLAPRRSAAPRRRSRHPRPAGARLNRCCRRRVVQPEMEPARGQQPCGERQAGDAMARPRPAPRRRHRDNPQLTPGGVVVWTGAGLRIAGGRRARGRRPAVRDATGSGGRSRVQRDSASGGVPDGRPVDCVFRLPRRRRAGAVRRF